MNMRSPPSEKSPLPDHRLRSGTAARLSGLPVTTLRVWERRYGVAASAARTDSGQRFYSLHDVARLRLLRQLTQEGHAIGSIASLELAPLQALADGLAAVEQRTRQAALDAVVVGRSAAHALGAVPGCRLRAVHLDLAEAEAQASAASHPEGGVGLLLIRLASLQPTDVDRLLALVAALRADSVFVVYAFGTEASADGLRRAGATVRREPLMSRDLAQWVRAARARLPRPDGDTPAFPVARAAAGPEDDAAWPVAPRRFDDDALARIAAARSPIACECLRHLAEIVAQLAGFERYSQDCLSTGPADHDLHRQLARNAGAARTLFEASLQRVLADEGLDLPTMPGE